MKLTKFFLAIPFILTYLDGYGLSCPASCGPHCSPPAGMSFAYSPDYADRRYDFSAAQGSKTKIRCIYTLENEIFDPFHLGRNNMILMTNQLAHPNNVFETWYSPDPIQGYEFGCNESAEKCPFFEIKTSPGL